MMIRDMFEAESNIGQRIIIDGNRLGTLLASALVEGEFRVMVGFKDRCGSMTEWVVAANIRIMV